MSQMAKNLKMLRAKANMTQENLCTLIGVSRQTIVQAEQSHKMSWNTYISLVFIFSREETTNEIMRILDIYPTEIDAAMNKEVTERNI